jgi:hypothetical protein
VETSSTTTARLASCAEEQVATEANANWSKSMLAVARWMRRIGGKREKGRGDGFNYQDGHCNGVCCKRLWTVSFGAKTGWRVRESVEREILD